MHSQSRTQVRLRRLIGLVSFGASFAAFSAFGPAAMAATATAAAPFPTKDTPAAVDSGAAAAAESGAALTLSLKLKDRAGAEAFLESLYDRTSPNFHRFLTPEQYRARFALSDAAVADVVAKLQGYGLAAERTGATTLHVSGAIPNLERAFQVDLHVFEVPARGSTPAFRYHAPTHAATIPAELAGAVDNVVGLSSRPKFVPHYMHKPAPVAIMAKSGKPASGKGTLVNAPGTLTVADFTQYYDAGPLLAKGLNGGGRTLAIVTLAAFTPSDAYAYWSAVGLTVAGNRIRIVDVDGGPGAPSDYSGSIETSLDVEQSGGIAPAAKVIVYQAPNTDQAFLDAFVSAVEGNVAQSISTSWGSWEWYDDLDNGAVTDPYTHATVSSLQAFDAVFMQAAIQGQSLFAAAGDAGAYEANYGTDSNDVPLLPPNYSTALSVDYPASDPFITAAGGTTLPGEQFFSGGLTVTIPNERIWSWDYLQTLCNDLGYTPIGCGIFPAGGGGGVSFEFPMPSYQKGVPGMQRTEPGQALIYENVIPFQTVFAIPAYYVGRNVPDISANADPDTGYEIYYTSDQTGFGIDTFYGGTSFVGPQLNGVVALIGPYVHGRIGFLNPLLYELLKGKNPYSGTTGPFNAIIDGTNDFYAGRKGYNQGAGIGTLDIANFAESLQALKP
jgi:subtilase family serine protease